MNLIITSLLIRAQQTNKIIGDFYSIPIEINDQFKEGGWGELQEKPKRSQENFIKWRKGITPKRAKTFAKMKQCISVGLNTVLLKENSIPPELCATAACIGGLL
ncbi:MAG: histidine phosphatase family protein [Candidatus Paracaedibacteraceae bacterium]|nr:histidine phosphatase family protein [Candidatus Paracaedibacteraceae bacterium]